jgi:hypothetical protein
MYNNFYKNQIHLIDRNTGASFVCPMNLANNRGNGFYKYYEQNQITKTFKHKLKI